MAFPFSFTQNGSKKSLPKIKAPIRRARLFHDEACARKPKTVLKKISVNLDGVASTLMKDGNWCIDHENKADSRELLHQTQLTEKLTREKEILKRRNDILMDMAKGKTKEIDSMEKELRELRTIVKKCAPKKDCKV